MALLARASGNLFQFSNNCFYRFSLNCMNLKLYKNFPCNFAACPRNSINTKSNSTGRSLADVKKSKYVIFDDAMSQRRDQARRSILVQVQSENSSYELYNYCSEYGKVEEMQHYTINGSVHFILIEFKTQSDVDSITSVSTHAKAPQTLPVASSMLWFRASANGVKKGSFSKDIPLKVTNGKVIPQVSMINNWIYQAESMSDQMTILYNLTRLNDTDTRLRFLSARQIEVCFAGMFSDISVLPFGSSVNGFGKHGCDLDLVLKLQSESKDNPNMRLVYHTKTVTSNERLQAQKVMETMSDVMQLFLPGITSIRRILRARVPIIKYNQTLTALECDLSMTNTTGIHMSELLYLYGELDWRVRPLTFTIRMWASCVHLTNSSPGHWITNFSLTLLVLFYLQQKQILPSLQNLVKFANKDDVRIADGCVDCTFVRDISRLPEPPIRNKETLAELLTDFFIYYSSFDFVTKAISLNQGVSLPKPEESNIYIYNPLEQGLNVTKNMNTQETERLRIEMRNAAWMLDSGVENKSRDWGVLSLFHQKTQHTASDSLNSSGRMLELSSLFKKPSIIDEMSQETNTPNASISNFIINNSIKNKTSTVSNVVERQTAPKAKARPSRKQERRR